MSSLLSEGHVNGEGTMDAARSGPAVAHAQPPPGGELDSSPHSDADSVVLKLSSTELDDPEHGTPGGVTPPQMGMPTAWTQDHSYNHGDACNAEIGPTLDNGGTGQQHKSNCIQSSEGAVNHAEEIMWQTTDETSGLRINGAANGTVPRGCAAAGGGEESVVNGMDAVDHEEATDPQQEVTSKTQLVAPNGTEDDTGGNEGKKGTCNDISMASGQRENGDPAPATKIKKKSRKNKNQNRGPTALNKIRGTGFEENYADPPMTAEEFQEEQCLYSPENSFVDRIEECIQRYRGRRRLDSTRSIIFSRYLTLGGIDATQRQGNGISGLSKEDLSEMTASEKRTATATDVIHRGPVRVRYYCPGDEGWEVDFSGVVAGFLSSVLPKAMAGDPFLVRLGIETILNWLNYVVKHDVCPEYAADLESARQVCKTALVEFPLLTALRALGIGQFNFACRKIFNLDQKVGEGGWIDPINYDCNAVKGYISPRCIFVATLVFLLDVDHPARGIDISRYPAKTDADLAALSQAVTKVDIQVEDVRVVETRDPDEATSELFRRVQDDYKQPGSYHDAGVLVVESDIIEDGWANTPKRHDARYAKKPETRGMYILDAKILRKLRPGMLLRLETATVHHPDFSLKFIKNILEMLPSFHVFLPQELILDFREPRCLYRDPPSVDDPDDPNMDQGPGLEGCTDDFDDL